VRIAQDVYRDGKLHGRLRLWNEERELVLEEYYEFGRSVKINKYEDKK